MDNDNLTIATTDQKVENDNNQEQNIMNEIEHLKGEIARLASGELRRDHSRLLTAGQIAEATRSRKTVPLARREQRPRSGITYTFRGQAPYQYRGVLGRILALLDQEIPRDVPVSEEKIFEVLRAHDHELTGAGRQHSTFHLKYAIANDQYLLRLASEDDRTLPYLTVSGNKPKTSRVTSTDEDQEETKTREPRVMTAGHAPEV